MAQQVYELDMPVKGTSLEGLAEQFKGDTAIAFAHEEDPMSAARIPGGNRCCWHKQKLLLQI